MLQTTGDLWDQIGKACAICITTNGFAKRNGEAVMGRGCAAQAKKRYLGIERNLGRTLIRRGNFPSQIWKDDTTSIISFPVKGESKKILQASDLESIVKHKRNDFKINDTVPGWALKAEPEIIEQSAQHLVLIADIGGLNNIYLYFASSLEHIQVNYSSSCCSSSAASLPSSTSSNAW